VEKKCGGYPICNSCYPAIQRGKRPKFSIANNFCFGHPPPCLTILTEVELAFLTPIKTYGYYFCYTGGQKHKLVGSLSYYRVDKSAILTSVANLTASSANIVTLVYGEITATQFEMAKQKNRLRVSKLRKAIRWLLRNNSEWARYCRVSLRRLVKSIQNPTIIQTCSISPDSDLATETSETFTVYFPDGTMNTTTGGQSNIGALQDLVHLANVNHHDIAYRCNLWKEAAVDYKDNNLVNACLLQFPYGRGGMHER
jgi:hypothetical protein